MVAFQKPTLLWLCTCVVRFTREKMLNDKCFLYWRGDYLILETVVFILKKKCRTLKRMFCCDYFTALPSCTAALLRQLQIWRLQSTTRFSWQYNLDCINCSVINLQCLIKHPAASMVQGGTPIRANLGSAKCNVIFLSNLKICLIERSELELLLLHLSCLKDKNT